jgi:hypothetical protein
MQPLDDNSYHGITTRPRMGPRTDNRSSTQHNNCQHDIDITISNLPKTHAPQGWDGSNRGSARNMMAAAMSLGAVTRYKGAE